MILLYRVIKQKQTMRTTHTWQKNRLMYIQLLSISILFFLIRIPFVTVSLVRLLHNPFFLQDVTMLLLNYCLYICPLASPFISLVGLPTVRRHLSQRMGCLVAITQVTDNRIRPAAQLELRGRFDESAF